MNPEFSKYVLEYQAEGIGELLYAFIYDVVERVVRRYPAATYSPNNVWDEDAISGLCNDFIIEKLLRAGWLEHYLTALEAAEQLQYALKRDFRHFLINRRKRDEFQNLARRLHHLLTTNALFKNCAASTYAEWGLNDWNKRDGVQRLDEVVQAMYKVPLPPLTRYGANSRKVSHLISNDDLRRLIVDTFRELNKCVEFSLLLQAMRYRLNLLDIEPVSLDEPLDKSSFEAKTYEDIVPVAESSDLEIGEIAHRIYEQLTVRQRHAFSTYVTLEKPTLDTIGAMLNISKSAAGNDLAVVKSYIVSAELTYEEAEKLLVQLSELCAEQGQ